MIRFTCIFLFIFCLDYSECAASTNLDSLIHVVQAMPEDSVKCASLIRIALTLYSGEEAISYGQKALFLARQLSNVMLIGRAYSALGWCTGFNQMDEKITYLDSAARLFTMINDKHGLGSVYNSRAAIHLEYGDLEEAQLYYKQAHDIFSDLGELASQAIILNNWAYCLNLLLQPEAAISKYEQALTYHLQQGDSSVVELARIYNGLGESYRTLTEYRKAADCHFQAYQFRKARKGAGLAESLVNVALLLIEALEGDQDTTDLLLDFGREGLRNPIQILEEAETHINLETASNFHSKIIDLKRRSAILDHDFEGAYHLLFEQKAIDDENKLSSSNLTALADLKMLYTQEQLKTQLLEGELVNQKKSNQVNVLLLFLIVSVAALIFFYLLHLSRIKSSRLLLAEAEQERQIVSMRSMLEGQENERRRIARDLHDGLGNLLSTLKANIGTLHINLRESDSNNIYAQASQMVDEACTEVRKIAHQMMPQALQKLGLIKALEDFVLRMDEAHNFEAMFQIYGQEKDLDDTTNVMLFRIIQELFNNIIKHAQATEVLLQLTFDDDLLNITVDDNGKGFDINSKDQHGMGLKSIAFRTKYLGGQYDIESRSGVGTLVSINLPIKNDRTR